MRRRLFLYAIIALVAYALLLLALWMQQDLLVFPGAGRGLRPIDVQGTTERQLPGLGNQPFRIVEVVPEKPTAVVLHFVGNGEDLCSAARHAVAFARYGVAVVSPEYPGYGGSGGRPSVASLLRTADVTCAHAEALAKTLGVPLFVSGSSLGTFSAVHVAAQGKVQKCLLRAPAVSIVEVAGARFWWVPVGMLLRHQFDNGEAAKRVQCPVLIVHGDADDVIPVDHGQRLRGMFAGPAEIVVVPGAGHNDLVVTPDGPVAAQVAAFLRAP